MSVLPDQATFGSFFVVLAVVMLVTVLLALSLQDLIALLRHGPHIASNTICAISNCHLVDKWRAFDQNLYVRYKEALDAYEVWFTDEEDTSGWSLRYILIQRPQAEIV